MEQRQWLLFNPAKIKLAANDNNLVSATLALILLKIVTKKNKSILTSIWLAITLKSIWWQKMKMQFRQERSSNTYLAKFLVLVCVVWSMIYHLFNCFIFWIIKWMTTASTLTFPLWANTFFYGDWIVLQSACLVDGRKKAYKHLNRWLVPLCLQCAPARDPWNWERRRQVLQMCPFNKADLY